MYSPKISEELIPKLFRVAKAKRIPMTKLINNILKESISNIRVEKEIVHVNENVAKENYFIQK